jgi:hypothetical protein
MASEQLLTLGLLAVLLLAAGGVSLRWYRRRGWRQQRQSSWRELCLRLELAPQPGNARVARGELPDTDFLLHDTGSDWLVELPLAQPLLPPGLVLLSPNAPTLPPHLKLRPLEWASASMPSGMLAAYVDWKNPDGKVEAPQAFLEEAARAAQTHAPLRVESRRLVHALRAGALLSVNEVRDAVKALHATARRWLAVAEGQGLPQVQSLPLPQPAPAPPSSRQWLSEFPRRWRETTASLLARRQPQEAERPEPPSVQAPPPSPPAPAVPQRIPVVVPHRVPRQITAWDSLRILNAGIPISLGLTLLNWEWVMTFFVVASAFYVQAAYDTRRIDRWGVVLWLMMLSTTLGAPMTFAYSQGWGSGSVVFPYLLDLNPREDKGVLQLLALLLWGVPNGVWLGRVLTTPGAQVSASPAPPRSEPVVSPAQVEDGPQPTRKGKKRKKNSGR